MSYERTTMLKRTRRMLAVLVAVGGLLTLSLGSAVAHRAVTDAGHHDGWAVHDWSSKLALIAAEEATDEVDEVDEVDGGTNQDPSVDEDAQGEDSQGEDADENDQGENEDADKDDSDEADEDDSDEADSGDVEEHDGDGEHEDDGEHDD